MATGAREMHQEASQTGVHIREFVWTGLPGPLYFPLGFSGGIELVAVLVMGRYVLIGLARSHGSRVNAVRKG